MLDDAPQANPTLTTILIQPRRPRRPSNRPNSRLSRSTDRSQNAGHGKAALPPLKHRRDGRGGHRDHCGSCQFHAEAAPESDRSNRECGGCRNSQPKPAHGEHRAQFTTWASISFMPREIKADLETDSGSFTDQAASGVDFPRYVRVPAPQATAAAPLQFERAVQPGGETKGIIIVTFRPRGRFTKRKLLRLTINGPDQLVPPVITK